MGKQGLPLYISVLATLVGVSVCTNNYMNFIVMGDWGCDCTIQHEVAVAMGKTASDHDSQFTIAAGDNFYPAGIHGPATDPRFNKTFANVYTAPALQKTWYVISGNHDHLGNVSAQIEYSKIDTRWHYPDWWYTESITIPGTDSTVLIVMIDTVVWGGDWPEGAPQPLGAAEAAKAQSEKEWVTQTLANAKEDWIFVVGHYPIWSVAEHGPTKVLVDELKPLLDSAGVAAYMNGHDHNVQHLVDGKINYFVTGNGGMNDPSEAHKSDVPKGSLKFFHDNGAYLRINVNATHFHGAFYDGAGKDIYQTEDLPNPRKTVKA